MSESACFLIKNEGTQMEPCETIPQLPSFTHPKKTAFEANQLAQIPLVCFVFKKIEKRGNQTVKQCSP